MKLRPVALAVALVLSSSLASATVVVTSAPLTMAYNSGTASVTVADSSANSVFNNLLAQPRNWTQGASAAADVAEVTDALEVAGPAGEIAMTATEAVGATEAAGAIAACAATVVCGVGAAVGAAAIGAGLYLYKMHNDAQGQIWQDPSQPPAQQTVGQWVGRAGQQFGSASDACNSYAVGLDPDSSIQVVNETATSAQCDRFSNNIDRGQVAGTTYQQIQQAQCPQIDLSGSAPAPFPDGSCPTPQASNKLLDQADAAAAMNTTASPMTPSAVVTAAVAAAVAGGMSVIGTPTATSGPASQTGATTSTTTTNPDGSSSTVTSTPTYKFDYAPDHVGVETDVTTHTILKDATGTTVSDQTGTTVTNPGGTGTGTGTTGTGTTGTGTSSTPADICALHPGIVACDQLGDPGTDAPVWNTKNITFAPEDIGMPSGCPAPRTFTVRNIVFTLNYQPACDVAPVVSAALVAFCALGCGIWIVAQIKG